MLLPAFLCLLLLPAAASQKPRSPRAKPRKVKVQPPPAPPVPAPPPTPQQLPPNPPQVTYRDGLLTIHAQNSTLADILAAVRAQTGATIDMPGQGGSERVFFNQGPAPARDVLAALLNGSSFDYILLGSAVRPGDLQRILLLPKSAGGPATAAAGPPPAPAAVNPNPDVDEGDEGVPDESEPMPAQPAPEQVVPTPSNQPKTPEQLLEELRQQQLRMQQQQQQQQQQNPPPQPPQ